ncbi:unnamed protein product, partial [Rotaria sordida]
VKWLDPSDTAKIDYCVCFESDSIFVCDRQYQHHAFLTSSASERLDRYVFYLDEIYIRTDFKFSSEFRAAVTLGNSLSKDRSVQACMRMRKLGIYHWLSFWSSNEVHQQIEMLKKNLLSCNKKENIDDEITLIANWLRGQLQSVYHKQSSNDLFTTTLRLLLPRTKRDRSIIVNKPTLTIAPLISVNRGAIAFPIPVE